MAAFAYVLLPASGLAAYVLGRDPRTRFHGLQAIAFGLLWAVVLYAASALSPAATRLAFAIGGAVWLLFIVLTAAGHDPRLPLAGRALERAAEADPRAG